MHVVQAVRNERNTEDILEYKHDLVARVQQRLDDQVGRGSVGEPLANSHRSAA